VGIGDRLLGKEGELSQINSTDPGMPYSAYESLTSGKYQEWMLGFELQVPIGFRRELAGVRNAQLMLARERVVLQEQELEVTHQLTAAFRDLADNYVIAQTDFNRRFARRTRRGRQPWSSCWTPSVVWPRPKTPTIGHWSSTTSQS